MGRPIILGVRPVALINPRAAAVAALGAGTQNRRLEMRNVLKRASGLFSVGPALM